MVQLFTAVVSWYILVLLIVKSWTQCIKLRFHEEKRIKIPTHDVPFTYFPTHNNVEIYQLLALCHKTTLRVCLFNHIRFIQHNNAHYRSQLILDTIYYITVYVNISIYKNGISIRFGIIFYVDVW